MMPLGLLRLIARALIVTLLSPFFAVFASPAFAGDGTCSLKSRVCIEGPETRMISGYPVTRACWKYESVFDCVSQNYVDDCAPLVDKGCAQIGSTCIDTDAADKCVLYEQSYQCKLADGASNTITDCGGRSFCMDGACFDAGYQPDGDFGMTMTGLEAARQMGNYMDPDSLLLFSGVPSNCSIKLGGLGNCCKSDTQGGGSTNSSFMTQMGMSAVKSVGSETISYMGSRYMYDSLFQSDAPNMMVKGFASMIGDGGAVADMTFTPSMSYFGLTVSYGGATTGMVWSTPLGNSGFYVGFDPMSFAISIAIYFIMEILSCDQDEQVLAMRRGQNLCVHVGSWCSTKVLKVCIVKKESHCCFNSRIARIIAVAGRSQLGMDWGSAKSPSCAGFTAAQIQMIDFSQIDFSEVIADIKANVKLPDYAVGRATTMMESYFAQ